MKIHDLTMPIEEHFRWPVKREARGDPAKGDLFQVTRLELVVHAFTHVDAPCHMVPGGATTSDTPLERLAGEAAVIDLSGLEPETAITPDHLAERGGHLREGDIAVLKTTWDEVHSPHTPEFWTRAPYLTRAACQWLLEREIAALAVDFPQDYPIRLLLEGRSAPIEDFVSHDVLLRNGVLLIEYLCNTRALTLPRTTLFALPLKLPAADGAPARVIAVEN